MVMMITEDEGEERGGGGGGLDESGTGGRERVSAVEQPTRRMEGN